MLYNYVDFGTSYVQILACLMCRLEHVLCVDSCGFLATLAWLASLAIYLTIYSYVRDLALA